MPPLPVEDHEISASTCQPERHLSRSRASTIPVHVGLWVVDHIKFMQLRGDL